MTAPKFAKQVDIKRIVSRLHVIQAVAAAKGETQLTGGMDEVSLVSDLAFGLCRRSSANDVPLDVHLNKNAQELARIANGRANPVVSELRRLAVSLSCTVCAAEGQQVPCNGGRHDRLLRDAQGHCVAPFRRLLNKAAEITSVEYQKLPQFRAKQLGVRVHLGVTIFADNATDETTAMTHVVALKPARKCNVELQLQLRNFGQKVLSGLPYIFLHELVAHAYHEVDNVGSSRETTPDDSFVEGFMDEVAYEIARDWFATADAREFLGSAVSAKDAAIATDGIHWSRFEDGDPSGSQGPDVPQRAAVFRRTGLDAAVNIRALLDEMSDAGEGPDDPRAAFLEFALALNAAAGVDVPRRREVFVQYAAVCPLTRSGRGSPREELVRRLLRNYIQTQDAYSFLEQFDLGYRVTAGGTAPLQARTAP